MSRRLEFRYDILLEFDCPVVNHSFVLRCLPRTSGGQRILDATLKLEPGTGWTLQKDSFGNLMQIGCIDAPHSSFHYSVQGSALTGLLDSGEEPAPAIYRYPSQFTGIDGAMRDFLAALSLPSQTQEKAWAISQAVHEKIKYIPGVTNVKTTAVQAFQAANGVCQDYAHVYLALARQAGLTARYCNGLTEGEGASHAWCEVSIDGKWVGIDPTRGKWTDESYLRFNTGRDFGDCPMERGIFTGNTAQRQTVFMQVSRQNQGHGLTLSF